MGAHNDQALERGRREDIIRDRSPPANSADFGVDPRQRFGPAVGSTIRVLRALYMVRRQIQPALSPVVEVFRSRFCIEHALDRVQNDRAMPEMGHAYGCVAI